MIRSTHTYVILDLSPAAYAEIAEKLRLADYDHCFHKGAAGRSLIDMHGIAVAEEVTHEKRKSAKHKTVTQGSPA
jgi:hypothetical protein